jgi:uncharacterized tellurite resistance protein B-like protein
MEEENLEVPEEPTTDVDADIDDDEKQKGYLRQADYTRKTQELAKKRKEFESEAERIAREKEEVEAFKELATQYYQHKPEEYQAFMQFIENGGKMPEEPKEKKVESKDQPKETQEEILRNPDYERELQAIKQKQIDNEIYQAEQIMKAKYNLKEDEIRELCTVASQNFVDDKDALYNLENAYKLRYFEEQFKKGQEEEEKRRVAKKDAQIYGGGSRGGQASKKEAEILTEALFSGIKKRKIL